MNDSKTIFKAIGNEPQLYKLVLDSVTVGETLVESVPNAKDLGTSFASSMSMKHKVQDMSQAVYSHLQIIRRIKDCLRPPHQVLSSFTYIVRFPLVDRYWLLVP